MIGKLSPGLPTAAARAALQRLQVEALQGDTASARALGWGCHPLDGAGADPGGQKVVFEGAAR